MTFVLSSSSYIIDRNSLPKLFLIADVGKIGTTAVMFYWLSTFDVGNTEFYLYPGIGIVLGLFLAMLIIETRKL